MGQVKQKQDGIWDKKPPSISSDALRATCAREDSWEDPRAMHASGACVLCDHLSCDDSLQAPSSGAGVNVPLPIAAILDIAFYYMQYALLR